MLFENFRDNFVLSNQEYLNIDCTGVGSINVFSLKKGIAPYTCSANSKTYNTLIKKMYSEYLERSQIAIIGEKSNSKKCVNLCDNSTQHIIESTALSYNLGELEGVTDTTGTASGNGESTFIIKKALSELIEKNELYLFWYYSMGERLIIDDLIKHFLKKMNFNHYDNYFFKLNNLSSWPTIIFLVFKDEELITTGICCNYLLDKAIEGAIKEAKVLRMMNMYEEDSIFDPKDCTSSYLYNWINMKENTNFKMDNHFNYIKSLNIWISSDINNLYLSILNTSHRNNQGKTIRVFSPELLMCVPSKEQLKYCANIPLIKKYSHLLLDSTPNCLVL